MLRSFIVLIALSSLALSCGKKQVVEKKGAPEFIRIPKTDRCLKIVNGLEVESMQGVVMLTNASNLLCTGTYLGDNAVLTAAHCVDNSPTGGLRVANGPASTAVFHGGLTGESAISSSPFRDIAILLMPKNSTSLWRKIASVPPVVGDQLMVVGFGQTDFVNNNDADGKLRYGFNKVDAVSMSKATLTYSSPVSYSGIAKGQEAMSGRGDSGGAIIVGDGVVALTSGGDSTETVQSEQDFLLFSRQALDVMEAAEAKGAVINGINNVRKALSVPEKDNAPNEDTASALQPSC